GIHLLKVTGRLPLRATSCEAGAFGCMIVAAANDRASVRREGNRGDIEIVARDNLTRRFLPEIVDSYLLPDPAGKRLATGLESERPQAPRLGAGSLELAGGGIPDDPLALATRIASREVCRVAPAVVGPIAASAGECPAIGREGQGANPIAMSFE